MTPKTRVLIVKHPYLQGRAGTTKGPTTAPDHWFVSVDGIGVDQVIREDAMVASSAATNKSEATG